MKRLDRIGCWLVLLLFVSGCQQKSPDSPLGSDEAKQQNKLRGSLISTYDAEKLLVGLMPKVGDLSQSALNLKVPDYKTGGLFAERVQCLDLKPASPGRPVPAVCPRGNRATSLADDRSCTNHSLVRIGDLERLLQRCALFRTR